SMKEGNLTLQDSKTVFAVLDPMKLLGPSAFGPLKFRPIAADGLEGGWQPLVNLVRVPQLKEIHCPAAQHTPLAPAVPSDRTSSGGSSETEATEKIPNEKPAPLEAKCVLSGEKLFLIDAVSADPDFTSAVNVPDGFGDATLAIPMPKGKE